MVANRDLIYELLVEYYQVQQSCVYIEQTDTKDFQKTGTEEQNNTAVTVSDDGKCYFKQYYSSPASADVNTKTAATLLALGETVKTLITFLQINTV